MPDDTTTSTRPTIFEAAGGAPAFRQLVSRFYSKVMAEPMLSPLFANFTQTHVDHVEIWLGEVFGGPSTYSERFSGHGGILTSHLNLHISPEQRARWAELMVETAHEVFPADELLQQRFAEYIEWGTQIAQEVSQPGETIGAPGPVPHWGWDGLET
jgi:hemoglobin